MALDERSRLDRVGELAANSVEGAAYLGGEASHGDDGSQTDEACDESVLDEILTGLIMHEDGGNVLEVLHVCSPGFKFRGWSRFQYTLWMHPA